MATTVPFRVVLVHRGRARKFFTLFQGRDGSLYVDLYRPEGQPWRVPGTGLGASNEMLLDFANYSEPGFELHKISFHPSGYIHLSDTRGQRFKDGRRGPAFTEVPSPHDLCALVPPSLEQLPAAGNERGMVVDLVLPDDVGPFYTTLSLVAGEIVAPDDRGTLLRPVFGLPVNSGHKLAFVSRLVRNREDGTPANWPPFPFFLIRSAA